MFVNIACPGCIKSGFFRTLMVRQQYREDGIYDFVCKQGHHYIGHDNALKFEALFDIASNAMIDGYYRDAVTSYNASYERFNEFALKAIFLENNPDESLFNKYWKQVSAQTERQLGAFLLSYGLTTGNNPPIIDKKLVELRNNVVHKGYIPNKNDAICFGQSIFSYCLDIITVLRDKFPNGMSMITRSKANITTSNPELIPIIFGFHTHKILSLSNIDKNRINLIQELENLEFIRELS